MISAIALAAQLLCCNNGGNVVQVSDEDLKRLQETMDVLRAPIPPGVTSNGQVLQMEGGGYVGTTLGHAVQGTPMGSSPIESWWLVIENGQSIAILPKAFRSKAECMDAAFDAERVFEAGHPLFIHPIYCVQGPQ